MKSFIVRAVIFFIGLTFFNPCVYAGNVELLALKITKHKNTQNQDLFHFNGVIVNNTTATIPIAKVYTDRMYCETPDTYKNAYMSHTPAIAPGQSHDITGSFLPEKEQSIRFTYQVNRNTPPYVQKTISRKAYDSLGAQMNPCKKMKKRLTPKTSVPLNKLKKLKP